MHPALEKYGAGMLVSGNDAAAHFWRELMHFQRQTEQSFGTHPAPEVKEWFPHNEYPFSALPLPSPT